MARAGGISALFVDVTVTPQQVFVTLCSSYKFDDITIFYSIIYKVHFHI